MEKLSIFEKLSLSAIRIECILEDETVSYGTGFFFKFVDKGDNFVPAIVTNKHVVKKAENGFLLFTLSDKEGNPMHDYHHKFEIITEPARGFFQPTDQIINELLFVIHGSYNGDSLHYMFLQIH